MACGKDHNSDRDHAVAALRLRPLLAAWQLMRLAGVGSNRTEDAYWGLGTDVGHAPGVRKQLPSCSNLQWSFNLGAHRIEFDLHNQMTGVFRAGLGVAGRDATANRLGPAEIELYWHGSLARD
jgi:hypothetical protein